MDMLHCVGLIYYKIRVCNGQLWFYLLEFAMVNWKHHSGSKSPRSHIKYKVCRNSGEFYVMHLDVRGHPPINKEEDNLM